MVLSSQAQRAWKLGTAFLTVGTSFYSVFYVDYGQEEHCFSDAQRWYRRNLDRIMLGNNHPMESSSSSHETSSITKITKTTTSTTNQNTQTDVNKNDTKNEKKSIIKTNIDEKGESNIRTRLRQLRMQESIDSVTTTIMDDKNNYRIETHNDIDHKRKKS
mmetsp:Transcript_10662/g.15044  ORF Transcript_10662/g.15044 Transcript_10662/m.15044 type:complete len:160 (-) Transcript_10662:444-923(-)